MKKWILFALVIYFIYCYKPEPYVVSSGVSPTVSPTVTPKPTQAVDLRVIALQDYFLSKKASVEFQVASHAFVTVADQYELDWRLMPAIAGVESGFERAGNITDFNPFGYMCTGGPCKFASFEEAIARLGKTLGEGRAYSRYQESGFTEDLARVYNPGNADDWLGKVLYFVHDQKEFEVDRGWEL